MTPVQRLTIQTAKPRSSRFPHGAVETGYWFQDGDYVYLCDERGVRTGAKRTVPEGVDAKTIAILLLRSTVGRKSSSFDRKLVYQRLSY